ncbi:hypothetical protein LPTSP1_36790 [Leptospira johnsonii]|uniref:Uncharacterized protein n=1 Tax=Leptospira johnsonii TaxID=1917820 RepID=A0A2P2D7V3_9LEPT|nr:hypothetical protein LPTSP1_36790 [Leptospira johnsonii]
MKIKNFEQAEGLQKDLHFYYLSVINAAIHKYGRSELCRRISARRPPDKKLTPQMLWNALDRNSCSAIRRLALECEKIEGEKK